MENKVFICEIENHVCCESCGEVYMTTINCPICECSIAIELEDKKGECDCGINFTLEDNGYYERKLKIIPDFHKQMLEANKELQRVCNTNKTIEDELIEIGFYKGMGLDFDLDDKGNAIVYKDKLFYIVGSENSSLNTSLLLKSKTLKEIKKVIEALK